MFFRHNVIAHLIDYVCACSVTQSCPTLWDPLDCSPPVSFLSVEFPRQEYWSGLPCPPLGHRPDPGINPNLLHLLHWQTDSWAICQARLIDYSLAFIAFILYQETKTLVICFVATFAFLWSGTKPVVSPRCTCTDFLLGLFSLLPPSPLHTTLQPVFSPY